MQALLSANSSIHNILFDDAEEAEGESSLLVRDAHSLMGSFDESTSMCLAEFDDVSQISPTKLLLNGNDDDDDNYHLGSGLDGQNERDGQVVSLEPPSPIHLRSPGELHLIEEEEDCFAFNNHTTIRATAQDVPPPLPSTPPCMTLLERLLDEKEKRFWNRFAIKETNLMAKLNNINNVMDMR